jgi:hypothetical protein
MEILMIVENPILDGDKDLEDDDSSLPFPKPKPKNTFKEFVFIASALVLMSDIGAYTRVGISYFKIWKIETNYVS